MDKHNKGTCVDITPSGCIMWNGPNIPCLGLCKGDTISEIIVKLATSVCSALTPTDLSALDLTCIYTIIGGTTPSTNTEVSALTALSSAICSVNTNVEALATEISSLGTWKTNSFDYTIPTDGSWFVGGYSQTILGNIGITPQFGGYLPFTRDYIIQTTINYIGTINTNLTNISNQVGSFSSAISNLQSAWSNYTPPTISVTLPDCIADSTNGLVPLSNPTVDSISAINNIASGLCNYVTITGGRSDFQAAISRMPSAMKTYYTANAPTGWNNTPSNFAQLISNYELVINDLYTRVTSIENTCCSSTCSDIQIGFSVQFTGNNMIILFRNVDGTNIPDGFTDGGSVMTIVDDTSGNSQAIPLVISNNYQTAAIPTSALTPNGKVTFSLLYNMGNGTLTCVNNISKTIVFSNGCSYCTITVSGGD